MIAQISYAWGDVKTSPLAQMHDIATRAAYYYLLLDYFAQIDPEPSKPLRELTDDNGRWLTHFDQVVTAIEAGTLTPVRSFE